MSKKPNVTKKNSVYLKNRSATFNYAFDETLTAGMVLTGSEIKSIRLGKVSFSDSFCIFHRDEIWLKNLHIAPYEFAGNAGHLPTRDRKLLLNKREIRKWSQKVKEAGYTIIPLSIFINDRGLAKINIGLGKGKKLYDKRETIKEREMERNLREKNY